MSRRGEVTIECDMPTCQAELILDQVHLIDIGIIQAKRERGWRWDGRDICPDCVK